MFLQKISRLLATFESLKLQDIFNLDLKILIAFTKCWNIILLIYIAGGQPSLIALIRSWMPLHSSYGIGNIFQTNFCNHCLLSSVWPCILLSKNIFNFLEFFLFYITSSLTHPYQLVFRLFSIFEIEIFRSFVQNLPLKQTRKKV